MPIKVSYTDDKGNAIAAPDSGTATTTPATPAPVTDEERIRWNRMRNEANLQGIPEDALDNPDVVPELKQKYLNLLGDYNFPQDRRDAIRQDMIDKSAEQEANQQKAEREGLPNAMKEVGIFADLRTGVKYSKYTDQDAQIIAQAKTPSMGYVEYQYQEGNNPAKSFMNLGDLQKNIDDYLGTQDYNKYNPENGDKPLPPNTDVWQSPTVVNQQLVQKAGFYPQGAAAPPPAPSTYDPRFPTRDPITGRVTPAAQPATVNEDDE